MLYWEKMGNYYISGVQNKFDSDILDRGNFWSTGGHSEGNENTFFMYLYELFPQNLKI